MKWWVFLPLCFNNHPAMHPQTLLPVREEWYVEPLAPVWCAQGTRAHSPWGLDRGLSQG